MTTPTRRVVALTTAIGINLLGLLLLTALSDHEQAPPPAPKVATTKAPRVVRPPKKPRPEPPRPRPRQATPTPAPAPPQLPSFSTLARPSSAPVSVDPAARGALDAVFSDLATNPNPNNVADGLFGPPTKKRNVVREAGDIDQPPTVRRQVAARYPLRAEREGITGYVALRAIVEPDGRVSRVEITDASPRGVFEDAARDALSRWRFSPGRDKGRAVRVWITTRLEFEL